MSKRKNCKHKKEKDWINLKERIKNINTVNLITLSVDIRILNTEITINQEMKEIQVEIKENTIKGIDKIEIDQLKEETKKIRKVKKKGKIKKDQDQEIKNMIRRVRTKIVIVEETNSRENNLVRKKIEKDHTLLDPRLKMNVQDPNKVVTRKENKRKISSIHRN